MVLRREHVVRQPAPVSGAATDPAGTPGMPRMPEGDNTLMDTAVRTPLAHGAMR
jgi:hypothetical protein